LDVEEIFVHLVDGLAMFLASERTRPGSLSCGFDRIFEVGAPFWSDALLQSWRTVYPAGLGHTFQQAGFALFIRALRYRGPRGWRHVFRQDLI
jgi:hypothetical protein